MKRDEFQTKRTNIISAMLDNPDESGIYPTTVCYKALDALYDELREAFSARPAPNEEEIASKAVELSDHLSAQEQSFFLAGFQSAFKWNSGNFTS